MTKPRRDRLHRPEARKASRAKGDDAPAPTGRRSHLPEMDVTKPYVYGATRPQVPGERRMVERPTARPESAPTLKDQLEYLRSTIDDMLIDVENEGEANYNDVQALMRVLEDVHALVTGVEVVEVAGNDA